MHTRACMRRCLRTCCREASARPLRTCTPHACTRVHVCGGASAPAAARRVPGRYEHAPHMHAHACMYAAVPPHLLPRGECPAVTNMHPTCMHTRACMRRCLRTCCREASARPL